MKVSRYFPFATISDVRRAHEETGGYFFTEDSMRFFKSRIGSDVFHGGYFVTSEKRHDAPRLYTVRRATPSGEIDTVGEFQAYKSHRSAMNALRADQSEHYVGRVAIKARRYGVVWTIAARGWTWEDGSVYVVAECLADSRTSPRSLDLDMRPSVEQERRAVSKLLVSAGKGDMQFRRIRKTPKHSGDWLPSVYEVQ